MHEHTDILKVQQKRQLDYFFLDNVQSFLLTILQCVVLSYT